MNDDEIVGAQESLAAVLAVIDAGEIEATREEVAYIAGAADTLARLRDRETPR